MRDQMQLIEKAVRELYRREKQYAISCREMAEAEAEYRQKRAVLYRDANGTIADRNAQADLGCIEEYKRKIHAETSQALSKALLDDCRVVISARQSILSAQSRGAMAVDTFATKQT